MQPEPVTLTEGQEGTDMGFFHEVPGGCGDHTRAEHVVFQRQRPRFAAVLVSDAVCTFVRTLFQKPPFPPAALTCLSDHIATAVIPSQFACKETVFKRKNKLHFIFP